MTKVILFEVPLTIFMLFDTQLAIFFNYNGDLLLLFVYFKISVNNYFRVHTFVFTFDILVDL